MRWLRFVVPLSLLAAAGCVVDRSTDEVVVAGERAPAPLRYVWSYDPSGPCFSDLAATDVRRLPEPASCPPGFDDVIDAATTAYCANGHCACTNWIDCAHADEFAWGCAGASTPWLPLRVRGCARAAALSTPS
jgi:hypothetical protein